MGMNYETLYPLNTEAGVTDLLENYRHLQEARFMSSDFGLCDFIMDFDDVLTACLTPRQKDMILLHLSDGWTQAEVAAMYGLTQPTVNGHVTRIIKTIVDYHVESGEYLE